MAFYYDLRLSYVFSCYHRTVFTGLLLCRGVITGSRIGIVAAYVL
jgi:hypothetical protein